MRFFAMAVAWHCFLLLLYYKTLPCRYFGSVNKGLFGSGIDLVCGTFVKTKLFFLNFYIFNSARSLLSFCT